jgi:mannosyltransferase OCH1-like enzyme
MIPKVIHYCWFGGNPLPPLAVKCIESWKKHCPDYEIKEWNESNFDVNFNEYSKEAYKAKKWAFVSDVARLHVIYTEGGIYLDTDVEIIKPLDCFLNSTMFIGFENNEFIATGLGFGAEENFHIVKKMLDIYNDISFLNPNGTFDTTPCPEYNTEIMRQEGFIINNTKQTIKNVTVYSTEYFCPKDYKTNKLKITPNTHTIHHYDASWWEKEHLRDKEKRLRYMRLFGVKFGNRLHNLNYVYKTEGIRGILNKIKEKK